MRQPKNSPEILALSKHAQAILAGHWMLGKGCTLTLQNQASRFTERSRSAMDELIEAGIVSEEKADDGYAESRTYRLTEKGACLEYRKSLAWMKENGKFPLVEPLAE